VTDLDGIPGPGLEEYVAKARMGGRRPSADVPARIAELLDRRPDLAGLGVTYVLEAVCA